MADNTNLPPEKIYADDADFLTTSEHEKDRFTSEIGPILLKNNLVVNPTKTVKIRCLNEKLEIKRTGESEEKNSGPC